jgi:hypothetical protein
MKKKLEAELISIAHRILKLKNKSELVQLHQETQKLYEKLSVLVFIEDHFSDAKPTIGKSEAYQIVENTYEATPEIIEEIVETKIEEVEEIKDSAENLVEETTEEEILIDNVEDNIEEEITSTDEDSNIEEEIENEEKEEETTSTQIEEKEFIPAFELEFDSKTETIEVVKNETPPVLFEDLLGVNYSDPVFVKPEDLILEKEAEKEIVQEQPKEDDIVAQIISINKNNTAKLISLNERLSRGITIGLNDRIAFINNLFANSSEDYNRVLSQIMTFDTYGDVQQFIDDMVKPDYNNWEGKEEYAERFMAIIEKKFI